MPKAKPQTRLVPIVQVKLERKGSLRYENEELNNPAAAARVCRQMIAEEIQDADREHFVAVYLNPKNRPVGYHVVSVGTLTASLVHPREVFVVAIQLKAHSVIIAHNHPSGDPAPSREDREVTRRLVEAGKVVGIEVLDHVVIGEGGRYESFRERGMLQ